MLLIYDSVIKALNPQDQMIQLESEYNSLEGCKCTENLLRKMESLLTAMIDLKTAHPTLEKTRLKVFDLPNLHQVGSDCTLVELVSIVKDALAEKNYESLGSLRNQIIKKGDELILCSAIWYKEFPTPPIGCVNIDKGMVLSGHGHAQCIYQGYALTGKSLIESGDYEQGFLTSYNRFVSREEGAQIAKESGQVIKFNYGDGKLYSEDLFLL